MSPLPACRVEPLPDHQVAFLVDEQERLRWHFGPHYKGPFFYPLRGPSGAGLTRMGHPGAPNHDHHRSIWFAHFKVLGIDFWSMQAPGSIRQQQWLAYQDGDEALMAVMLHWLDGHDPQPLLEQEVIAAVRPAGEGALRAETLLEIQTTLRPRSETLELEQTNFGLLAVRVAKSISEHFGGGRLTDSQGRQGEPAIFGQRAAWMDYSGTVASGDSPAENSAAENSREPIVEGITFFDHPTNPDHPAHWHVRADGWMGASLCLSTSRVLTRSDPLVLRYLLHAHAGGVDASRSDALAAQFAQWPRYQIARGPQHVHAVVERSA